MDRNQIPDSMHAHAHTNLPFPHPTGGQISNPMHMHLSHRFSFSSLSTQKKISGKVWH
jgi:hypothetical protein